MMNRATRTYTRRASILLVLLLLLSSIPVQAYATEIEASNETNFTMTGTFDGQFDLSADDTKLFHLDGILPGDTWSGQIHITNQTTDKMAVTLHSIVSNLEDPALFEALTLDISINGESVYSGSYSTDKSPVFEPRYIRPNKTLTLDITVSLPLGTGNAVMGKEMDADWIFEARYDIDDWEDFPWEDDPSDESKPGDNPDIDNPQTGDDTNLTLLIGLPLISLAGLILILLYSRKKKTDNDNEPREV